MCKFMKNNHNKISGKKQKVAYQCKKHSKQNKKWMNLYFFHIKNICKSNINYNKKSFFISQKALIQHFFCFNINKRKNMARVIVITSGKGGVGKTTICANLGAKLAGFGFRVALIDADIGLNNLDVVMGIENKVLFDLCDVVDGKCRVKQALIQDERFPTLYVMPSAKINSKTLISGENMKKVINEISPFFDYILIDCPAGVDNGFHRAVYPAHEAIVVVTPHISSLRDADKVLEVLSNYSLENKSLIVNRVRGDMLLSGEIISVEKIVDLLNIDILGVIPEDDAVSSLSSLGAFAYGTSGAKAFSLLAENLHNGCKKIYDCTYKYRGVVGIIRRNIKRRV